MLKDIWYIEHNKEKQEYVRLSWFVLNWKHTRLKRNMAS